MTKKSAKKIINDIFSNKPKSDNKKKTNDAEKKIINKNSKNKSPKKPITQESTDPTPRRYTEDGLPIYTYEDLNIGKGGGTDDCPFDCNCCF